MKKKIVISKLFLYRHRFVIGYVILGLAYTALLFSLPLIAQTGLSQAEMDSAVNSYALNFDAPVNGDLVNLPYRLLQKLSIMIFGLTPYAIKLPSIIMGLLLGFLLILLLNRWFKSNVSLLASCLIVLSTPFLFLAGNGTPLIMLVFWPTLLLWLGSKIQGEKKPKPAYCFLFAVALLLAIFTPYMLYFAVFCVLFVVLQPHLRFVVRQLPKAPLILTGILVLAGMVALIMNMVSHPETIMELLFSRGFTIGDIPGNLATGFLPVISWWATPESVFLAPLLSVPILALALIGLFSTTKGFFASRNSIATVLLIFMVIITCFNPDAAIFFILPTAILVAHGLKYILEKWYGLFPENPYARVAAILPLSVLFGVMIVPSLLQYINGYRYNPVVANQFRYDLAVVRRSLTNETLVVAEEDYSFYRLLENSSEVKVVTEVSNDSSGSEAVAVLYNAGFSDNADFSKKYQLSQIITSPMKEKSDIIYLYTEKENK